MLEIEYRAIEALNESLDAGFDLACELCLACSGRVIVTGMGKSGHIGSKLAATLASTGTPSFFVHPGEASHGDLGMITPGDLVLAISNSGAKTRTWGDGYGYFLLATGRVEAGGERPESNLALGHRGVVIERAEEIDLAVGDGNPKPEQVARDAVEALVGPHGALDDDGAGLLVDHLPKADGGPAAHGLSA